MKGKFLSGLLVASLALTAAATPTLANPAHHGGHHAQSHGHHRFEHGRHHGRDHYGHHRYGDRHHGDFYRHHRDHDDDFGDDAAALLFGTAFGAMVAQGSNGN